jgi:hypothetical protein
LAEDTDISGKIGIMGAARRLSLLAQNEKAGDQIDTAAEIRAATGWPKFRCSQIKAVAVICWERD